jgi:hypothetical protein
MTPVNLLDLPNEVLSIILKDFLPTELFQIATVCKSLTSRIANQCVTNYNWKDIITLNRLIGKGATSAMVSKRLKEYVKNHFVPDTSYSLLLTFYPLLLKDIPEERMTFELMDCIFQAPDSAMVRLDWSQFYSECYNKLKYGIKKWITPEWKKKVAAKSITFIIGSDLSTLDEASIYQGFFSCMEKPTVVSNLDILRGRYHYNPKWTRRDDLLVKEIWSECVNEARSDFEAWLRDDVLDEEISKEWLSLRIYKLWVELWPRTLEFTERLNPEFSVYIQEMVDILQNSTLPRAIIMNDEQLIDFVNSSDWWENLQERLETQLTEDETIERMIEFEPTYERLYVYLG